MYTYVHAYVFITHKHIYSHIDVHFHTYVEYQKNPIRCDFLLFRVSWLVGCDLVQLLGMHVSSTFQRPGYPFFLSLLGFEDPT